MEIVSGTSFDIGEIGKGYKPEFLGKIDKFFPNLETPADPPSQSTELVFMELGKLSDPNPDPKLRGRKIGQIPLKAKELKLRLISPYLLPEILYLDDSLRKAGDEGIVKCRILVQQEDQIRMLEFENSGMKEYPYDPTNDYVPEMLIVLQRNPDDEKPVTHAESLKGSTATFEAEPTDPQTNTASSVEDSPSD